jgi:hypothetical protein
LPTLATLPIFWGLYRTLTNVASAGLLVDGFYFIPSLAGPTSVAQRMQGEQQRGPPHLLLVQHATMTTLPVALTTCLHPIMAQAWAIRMHMMSEFHAPLQFLHLHHCLPTAFRSLLAIAHAQLWLMRPGQQVRVACAAW